jgi:MoaD family protein
MKLTVKYFALFRDQVGAASETMEWEGGSADALFKHLTGKHSLLMPEAAALVAINDEMVDWETSLQEGDEVLFFPPVAGG